MKQILRNIKKVVAAIGITAFSYSTALAQTNWSLAGNNLAATGIFGSTHTGSSGYNILFYQNNAEVMRLTPAGNLWIGQPSTATSYFTVGSSSQFQVSNSGNLAYINGVPYNWPSTNTSTSGYLLTSDLSGNLSWTSGSANNWSLFGNSGTSPLTNFIGTSDANALVFKVNNNQSGWIDYTAPYSTFFGYQVATLLTPSTTSLDGHFNSGFGYRALYDLTTGTYNTAVGYNALASVVGGGGNCALGYQALYNNNGFSNTAMGFDALRSSSSGTGNYNTAIGVEALYSIFNAEFNTATGYFSLYSNYSGESNTANGASALYSNYSGGANVAVGAYSLYSNYSGFYNVVMGIDALYNNSTGSSSSAFGNYAGYNSTGSFNTFIGDTSGITNNTGTYNTFVGYNANAASGALTNATAIGANAYVGASNSLVLGSISGTNGATSNTNVGIGTPTPSEELDVNRDQNNGTAILVSNPNAGSSAFSELSASNGTNYCSLRMNGTGYISPFLYPFDAGILLSTGTNGFSFVSQASNSSAVMRFGTNNTEVARFDINGHFGIGTSSPNSLLHVSGAEQLGDATNSGSLTFYNSTVPSDYTTFQSSSSATTSQIYTLPTAYPTASGYALTSTTGGTLSWAAISAGSIGAWGITGNSGTIAGTNFIGTTDPTDWIIKTNSTERVRVQSGGNVGIGTSSPGSLLDVAGNIVVVGKIRTEKSKPLNFCPNEKNKKKIYICLQSEGSDCSDSGASDASGACGEV